jgi:hypothetical protein
MQICKEESSRFISSDKKIISRPDTDPWSADAGNVDSAQSDSILWLMTRAIEFRAKTVTSM